MFVRSFQRFSGLQVRQSQIGFHPVRGFRVVVRLLLWSRHSAQHMAANPPLGPPERSFQHCAGDAPARKVDGAFCRSLFQRHLLHICCTLAALCCCRCYLLLCCIRLLFFALLVLSTFGHPRVAGEPRGPRGVYWQRVLSTFLGRRGANYMLEIILGWSWSCLAPLVSRRWSCLGPTIHMK